MDAGVFILTLAGALRAIGVTRIRDDVKPLTAACLAAVKEAKKLRLGVAMNAKTTKTLGERLIPTMLDYKLATKLPLAHDVEIKLASAMISEYYMREICPNLDTEKMKKVARTFIHVYERAHA